MYRGIRRKLPRRANKYGAVSTHCRAGHFHRSKGEAGRCGDLHLLQAAKEIEDLKTEPRVMIGPIAYRPDWTYTEKGVKVTEDFKGVEGERFRMIKKLWPVFGDGVLRITKIKCGKAGIDREIKGRLLK
jgi:hypothetical protein